MGDRFIDYLENFLTTKRSRIGNFQFVANSTLLWAEILELRLRGGVINSRT